MSYSRRQLYALGEPIGDSATRLKPGGRVYGAGGGDGGQPSQQTQTTELPEWARPYAKDVLAKGQALTDINKNPYQVYGGERIAGFQPMQQQAFETAANMQPSAQLGLGTGLAGAAGLGALGTNYQAGRFSGGQFGNRQAAQYMSPYIEEAMQPQLREAERASQIQGAQQQAQAVGAGAFGGSRDALMRAERERNLGMLQGDIRAKGYQTAYEQAANQYNQDMARRLQAQQLGEQSRQYGAGLGMQGLQTALQSAGQLGQLGQTEYGQKMGITGLQSQFGAQQQAQAQRPLDMAYQDFLNQQNYPYKQLGFMSDMIRGLPLGQKSTSTVYEGSGPGMVQTLAGLGGAAYGFGKSGLFGAAEGGLMESYAGGGVTSPQNVENILAKLSDQQLAQAKEAALNRRDIMEAQMIDAEMAERASIRGGLGGAFNQIPEDQQEQMMAGGGIVAFAKGGDTYGNKFEQSMADLKAMANQAPPEQTPEQRDEAISARIPMLEKRYGPDITQPYLEETKAKRAALADQMEKDKGLAIAAASLKLLSPNKNLRGRSEREQLFAGLGEAGEAFVGEVGKLKKDYRDVDDKLRQSEILLATAQQSRKEGLVNKADAEETRARDLKREAYKTQVGIQEKVAQLNSGLAQTEMQGKTQEKVAGIHAGVQREMMNKPGEFERMLSDYEKRLGRKLTPTEYKEAMAEIGAARYGAKYTGPDTTFANDAKFQAELDKRTAMLNLQKARPGITQEEIERINGQIEGERQKLIEEFKQTRASGITSKAAPGAAPAPSASAAPPAQSPLYVTAPDGKTYRFKTQAEADKFRQQIGG
jgi:general stress protein YciG